MEKEKGGSREKEKVNRVLDIYTKLMSGAVITKQEMSDEYHVSTKSIQRDIEDVRDFLDKNSLDSGAINTVVYDKGRKGYRLERIYDIKLTNPEILAICKIMLDSRTLTKEEMDSLLKKLIDCCVPAENRKLVNELILNEKHHYIQPKHGKRFIEDMWNIGTAITEQRIIEFDYQGVQGSKAHHRIVEPAAIMNSGMYFYMVGFIKNIDKDVFADPNDLNPTIYRIDRMDNISVTNERYSRPYKDRFEEGEFRKRVQFMFSGKLKHIKFKYKGYSIEAVEDRLPTAKIYKTEKEVIDGKERNVYYVSAEVYGDGIYGWLRQQGEMVEVVNLRKND